MSSPIDLHGDLTVMVVRGERIPNKETLGLGLIGRGIAKVANLKIDAYVNIKLSGTSPYWSYPSRHASVTAPLSQRGTRC
jgi:hypothetical protein